MNRRKPAVTPPPEPQVEKTPLPRMGFTFDELADILCCGRTTVYETVKDWKIKVFYVGRKPMVSPWELERAIREQEKTAA